MLNQSDFLTVVLVLFFLCVTLVFHSNHEYHSNKSIFCATVHVKHITFNKFSEK